MSGLPSLLERLRRTPSRLTNTTNPQQPASSASGSLYLRPERPTPTTPLSFRAWGGLGRRSQLSPDTHTTATHPQPRGRVWHPRPHPPSRRLASLHSPPLPAPFSQPGRASLQQPSPESSASPPPPALEGLGHSRNMESGKPPEPREPGPGAETAAVPRWAEAKTFHDNLAPKKKPKSVNTGCGYGGRAGERSPG